MLIDGVGLTTTSLSKIVMSPLLSAMVAPVALLKFMVKLSVGSVTALSKIGTKTVVLVAPAAIVAVVETD